MSATDTKEMSRISDQHRKVALAIQRFYNLPEDENIPEYLAISFPDQPVETDLTAVTAQRDRALGLLKQICDSELFYHAPSCEWMMCYDEGKCDCGRNELLTEYEALRKGER